MLTKTINIHVRLNKSYIVVLDKHTIGLRYYALIHIIIYIINNNINLVFQTIVHMVIKNI